MGRESRARQDEITIAEIIRRGESGELGVTFRFLVARPLVARRIITIGLPVYLGMTFFSHRWSVSAWKQDRALCAMVLDERARQKDHETRRAIAKANVTKRFS